MIMINGLVGKKIGMSQYIEEDGTMVPVTILQAGPCTVTQVKNVLKDGYDAVQLGFETLKKANKPKSGHLQKTGLFRFLREIRTENIEGFEIGQEIGPDIFSKGELIRLTGHSKGRGFQGTVKRHGFAGQARTHGQSDRERAPGSIGMGTTPGRVFKGKKMSGHMGDEQVTQKGIEVVKVDSERNLLFVKGGVPGARNGLLMIYKLNGSLN